MLDIQSHLLHGIEDGTETMKEACMMVRFVWDIGAKGIVFKPHRNTLKSFANLWNEEMSQFVDAFREMPVALRIPLAVMMGLELFATDHVSERIRANEAITLNGLMYILLEFWSNDRLQHLQWVLDSVAAIGLVPVMVRPERSAFLQAGFSLAEKRAAQGYIIQLLKGSILGSCERRAWKAAHALLEERLVGVAASDGHSPYERTPIQADAYEHIENRYSCAYVEHLLRTVSGRIVCNHDAEANAK